MNGGWQWSVTSTRIRFSTLFNLSPWRITGISRLASHIQRCVWLVLIPIARSIACTWRRCRYSATAAARRLCRLHNKGCTSRKRRLPLSLLQAVSAYAVRASRLSGLSSSPKDRQDWMPRCKSSRATWPKVATVKRLSSTSWRRHHCRSARKAVTPPFYRTTSMRAGYSAAHATSGGTGLALCTSTYSTRTAGHSTADPASSMSVFRRMFKNCCLIMTQRS
mmetsp:Transcript_25193/g.81494  ORF Transcript_25193/g.81494 Transcript_25193/m.81494 type:complete len:221 (-) Transcript_25193:1418-2080(-)